MAKCERFPLLPRPWRRGIVGWCVGGAEAGGTESIRCGGGLKLTYIHTLRIEDELSPRRTAVGWWGLRGGGGSSAVWVRLVSRHRAPSDCKW